MIKTKQWSVGGGSATIQYEGQGDGNITITSDANSLYGARSMQITVETTNGSPKQTKTITINQAAKQRIDLSAAVVTASNQTYSGSAKTPTPTVTLNGSTVPSSGYDVSYSNNTNAGTATITVTGKGDYTGSASGTFNIAKANPTYTAPAARSLTYSGSSQYLTTLGSTSHGTIQYSADGTNWYTTRRTGTSAGSYTTYWRLIGDSNHNDIASTSISVTIAQATGSVTTAPSARDVTYTGSSQYLVTSGSGTGTMYYRYKLSTSSSWSSWSTTRPSRTNAGTYNIEYYAAASSDGNYTQSATGSLNVEMKKAASSVTAAPTAKSLTYSRSAQSLVNAGSASGGTLYYKYTTTNSKPTSTSGFSSSIPTRTNASTYYVWYYVKADSNHNDTAISSAAVTVTIAKATPVLSTSPSARTGLSYTGSAQNLLSGGAMKHSSSDSTSVSGTFTYAKGTNAGTYSSLTWSFTPTDSTNYNSTSGSISGSVTIAKASRTISWSSYPSSLYVGSKGTLSATASAGSSDGTISYSSSSSSKASISGSTVTAVASGSCTIYASISEGTNYLSASTSYTLTVNTVPSGCVNMGLPSGLLWAEKNIGASTPYAYECDFFSWGNTDGHAPTSSVSFSPYSWGTANDTEPYVSSAGAALTGNIPLSQDAARVNLGSPWRMPTKDDFKELFDNCDFVQADGTTVIAAGTTNKIVTVNGVVGIYLKSKINGNLLFFACSGLGNGASRSARGMAGIYRASTLYSSNNGYELYFSGSGIYPQTYGDRFYGFPVRAVQ